MSYKGRRKGEEEERDVRTNREEKQRDFSNGNKSVITVALEG